MNISDKSVSHLTFSWLTFTLVIAVSISYNQIWTKSTQAVPGIICFLRASVILQCGSPTFLHIRVNTWWDTPWLKVNDCYIYISFSWVDNSIWFLRKSWQIKPQLSKLLINLKTHAYTGCPSSLFNSFQASTPVPGSLPKESISYKTLIVLRFGLIGFLQLR